MSTSAEKIFKSNRQARTTAFVYLVISIFCILFDKIYALFGHGVSSLSMSLMFLYPLLGGVLPFLALWLFVPRADRIKVCRPAYNCYNSGIAALTVQSMLNGVFEIAGTSSNYLAAFQIAGWLMLGAGVLVFLINIKKERVS